MSASTNERISAWVSSDSYSRWMEAIRAVSDLNGVSKRQDLIKNQNHSNTLSFTKSTVPSVRQLLRSDSEIEIEDPSDIEIGDPSEIEIEESLIETEKLVCDSCEQSGELFENEEDGRSLCQGCHPFFQQENVEEVYDQVPMSEETSPSQIPNEFEEDQSDGLIISGVKNLQINFGAPSSIQLP